MPRGEEVQGTPRGTGMAGRDERVRRPARPAGGLLLLAALVVLGAAAPAWAVVIAGPVGNPANGHLYYLLSGASWAASEAEAEALGGGLATIRSAAEDQWVYATFGGYGGTPRDLWIGLQDPDGSGVFSWVSGAASGYRNWGGGEPAPQPQGAALIQGAASPAPGFWGSAPAATDTPCGVVEIIPAPPDTVISLQPASRSNSAAASFGFGSALAGAAFECALDGGPFAPCTAPVSYQGLAEGSHGFQVRALDQAGNADPTPASFTWTVDLTPPNTTLTLAPGNPSNSTSPGFIFASTEPESTFHCRLDGSPYAPCTTPVRYTGLSAGNHTFQVKAVDPAGNGDPTPVSYAWTIDLIQPETSIGSRPPLQSNSSAPAFSFSSSKPNSGFECSLDLAPFAPCSSPRSYPGTAEGSHTFRVKARDLAGNSDPTPASYSWTVDLSAPQTSITGQPANPAGTPTAAFSFGSSEPGSSFECTLDGAPFAPCGSPASYPGLSQGSHTFQVRATDPAGNSDPTPVSYAWEIDLTPPALSAFSVNPTVGSLSVEITELGAPDGAAYLVSESGSLPPPGAPWRASAQAPVPYSFPRAGLYTLYAFARDAAGNVSAPLSAPVTVALYLTAQPQGRGGGTVSSIPAGIACASGQGAGCSSAFDCGEVRLVATPSAGSIFEGWSGSCGGAGECNVAMTANGSVTATFSPVPLMRMGELTYATLQAAYDEAPEEALVQIREGEIESPLVAERKVSVTLVGGYGADFGQVTGETRLVGTILLRDGVLRARGIYLR